MEEKYPHHQKDEGCKNLFLIKRQIDYNFEITPVNSKVDSLNRVADYVVSSEDDLSSMRSSSDRSSDRSSSDRSSSEAKTPPKFSFLTDETLLSKLAALKGGGNLLIEIETD